MEQEKNPGARGKIKKEQGAQKNEKGARIKVKKGAMGKTLKGAGSKRGGNCVMSKEHGPPPNRGSIVHVVPQEELSYR